MSPRIEEIEYIKTRGLAFSNSQYEAVMLPERGANLIRLLHKPRNIGILREPSSAEEFDAKRFEFGTPVLFFPNRIEDGRFVFDGREYRFPITDPKTNCHLHGFLHDKTWRVDEAVVVGEENVRVEASYRWGEREEELRVFPHVCLFRLVFELSERGLRQEAIIKNEGRTVMPLGFGYHTSFSVPLEAEHEIRLPLGRKWLMNDRHFPTGELTDGDFDKVFLKKDTGRIFGHYSLGNGSLYGAMIRNGSEGYRVSYRFDTEFRHLVVWNKTGGDGFICIEPQTCAVNAFNMDRPASETGCISLGPGRIFRAATALDLEVFGEEDGI